MVLRNDPRKTLCVVASFLFCAGIGERSFASGRTETPIVSRETVSSLKKIIVAHRGNVVIVNFWGTFCPGCRVEFPALYQARERYGKRGLVVLFVSADLVEDVESRVRPFLRAEHAHRDLYIINQTPEAFIPNFDRNWQGGLPRTYLFDRQGHFRAVTSDIQTPASVKRMISPYL